jgi:glutathione synthase/RimK-type ligase-like ATP-grasp enzyme
MRTAQKPLAIYYEHPDWFRPLFAELDRRRTPYVRLQADRHYYDVAARELPFGLLFNRMSASSWTREHGNAIFYTHQFLSHLERRGVRVVNGHRAFTIETSKALQLSLFDSLGLPYPAARVINHPAVASEAAHGLHFPVVIKPNVGGRGAGIVRFDTPEALARTVAANELSLGFDSTALVQEYVPARGSHITRVEVLGGKFLYAIEVSSSGDDFNLCPAEICQTERRELAAGASCVADAAKPGLRIEACQPSAAVIREVEELMKAAGIEVGGVEYIVDDRDGRARYYDINALSNFVANAPDIVGFDPHERLVDYLEQQLQQETR